MKALQVLGFSKDLNASMKKERKTNFGFLHHKTNIP
jgi:hypothetical protein